MTPYVILIVVGIIIIILFGVLLLNMNSKITTLMIEKPLQSKVETSYVCQAPPTILAANKKSASGKTSEIIYIDEKTIHENYLETYDTPPSFKQNQAKILVKPKPRQMTTVTVNPSQNPIDVIQDKRDNVYKKAKPVKKYGQMESKCRAILEEIFSDIDGERYKFPSCRPKWLMNPLTKTPMELDCYNEKLQIAAEYQGYQHYEYPNIFHKTMHEFEKQLRRDQLKKEICAKANVMLICIPYNIQEEDLKSYILGEIARLKDSGVYTD